MAVDLATDNTRLLAKRAADELLADGDRPTVANVRHRIGRGSASTINAALQEWWAELSQRLVQARSQPEVPAPLAEAMSQLWTAALEQAHHALAEYRNEADRKVTEATDAAAIALLARDEATKALQALQQDHQALADTRINLERQLTVETERREVAERQIGEVRTEADGRIAEARDRIRQLEELLERERTRYDAMENRLTQQIEEQKVARLKAEAHHRDEASAWRKEKNQLLGQNQETHRRLAEVQGRNLTLTEQTVALRNQVQGLQSDKEVLLVARSRLEVRLNQIQNVEETLRSEINALKHLIKLTEEDRTALKGDLDAARKALADGGSVGSLT